MSGIHIEEGPIDKGSRLYRHLTEIHRARAMGLGRHPDLRLRRLGGSHAVFLLTGAACGTKFVLKSFYETGKPLEKTRAYMDREYDRLKQVRRLGISGRKCKSVKPICRDAAGPYLVVEYVDGRDLGSYLKNAMGARQGSLFEKLDLIACYLARLHSKTLTGEKKAGDRFGEEIGRHALQSHKAGAMDTSTTETVTRLARRWCDERTIREADRCLVHGDATVSNFLYQDGSLFVIDFERSRYWDPAYDLGTLSGELFHEALSHSGYPADADPYIGHLYRSYARHCPDRQDAVRQLAGRNPFYMANSLLRMSRNLYLSLEYRRRLARHARECLQGLPQGGRR